MKTLVAVSLGIVLCAGSAHGGPHVKKTQETERAVRIFFITSFRDPPLANSSPKFFTGSVVPAELINTMLFLKEPCTLPIEGAKDMLRAWQALGAYQLGCWYPTADGKFAIIDGAGDIRSGGIYWETFPRALLHPDGSATIIEKDYDSATFMSKVSQRKVMEIFSHLNEKP